jgi:RHS repeat-associated protein
MNGLTATYHQNTTVLPEAFTAVETGSKKSPGKINGCFFQGLDYYLFGSLMPGRNMNASDYRFGFNGKLRDDSWHDAAGTVYDYGFRIYNARIGKFLSRDPLSGGYPWYAPYQFAGNTPIMAIDLEGKEPLTVIDKKGKITRPILGLLSGAFGFSEQTTENTTFKQSIFVPRGYSGITIGKKVLYSKSMGEKDVSGSLDLSEVEKIWIRFAGHELIHREHINALGNSVFYKLYITEYIIRRIKGTSHSKAYRELVTETIAYDVEAIIKKEIKQYSNEIGGILHNSTFSDEEKRIRLKYFGLINIYIPTLEKQLTKLNQLEANNEEERKQIEQSKLDIKLSLIQAYQQVNILEEKINEEDE